MPDALFLRVLSLAKGEDRCIYGIYEKTVANWKKLFIIEHTCEINK